MDLRWRSSKISCSSLGRRGGAGPRGNVKGALLSPSPSSEEGFEGVVVKVLTVPRRVALAMEGVKARAPRDAKREVMASETGGAVIQSISET